MLHTLLQMPTTLTCLTLIMPTILPIASILDAFPNLSSLECSSIAVDPIMLHSRYPKMQIFKLHCKMYADYETASCILPRFPSLHTLLFEAITDRFAKILSSLPDWCPGLQHINLGNEHRIAHPGVTLILAMKDTSFNGSDIISFLEQYAALVENLILDISLVDFPKHFISSVQFKKLKYMQITYNNVQDPRKRLCEWLLRHAPFLESFHVCNAWTAGDSVFDAMTRLNRLQVAEIPFSWDTIRGQAWFLNHHCTLGSQSNLQCLVIRMMGSCITGHTLHLLAGLKHVKRLSIIEDDHGGVFCRTPRLLFENLIRGCTSLTHLTLDAFTWIDNSVIEAVSKSKTLKHLTLVVDDISDIAIHHLLSCPQLKTLHLSTNKAINPVSGSDIQEKTLQLIHSKRTSNSVISQEQSTGE